MQVTTPDSFQKTLQYPRVREIISDFKRWNTVALPLMGTMSEPYMSIQRALVKAMRGRTGKTILDYGCGSGAIIAMLIKNGASNTSRVIAVDPDRITLQQVPQTLQSSNGFHGQVELVNSSSMVPLPLPDAEVDTIVSGLGAIIYSGFHFNSVGPKEGKEALLECLKDCNRVLKLGGYLGFSSLVPNPDFKRIKRQSILSLLKGLRLKALWTAIRNASKIEKASHFMKECAQAGWAHYLTEQQWQDILQSCGFTVIEFQRGSYAGQGLVVVAQKISNFK